MSESLPHSGVATVALSRYEVTTQERFSISARLRPMVGSAGATMVCSSALKNIASMMPMMIERAAAWPTDVTAEDAGADAAMASVVLMRLGMLIILVARFASLAAWT